MEKYSTKFLNKQYLILMGILLVLLASAAVSRATGLHVHHDLRIELFPAAGRLTGIDDISIKSAAARVLE